MTDLTAFGLQLGARRRSAGLSQQELAERSGLSVRAVSNLERGRARWPHPGTVHRLADALGLRDQERAQFISAVARRLAGVAVGPVPDDQPACAAGGLIVPRQLPAAVPFFAGRRAQLAALTDLLDQAASSRELAVVAVDGAPGVGKTALAVHWAHQAADQFPDGQLYVNLQGFGPSDEIMLAPAVIRGFLDGLGVSAGQIPQGEAAQAGLYRSLLAGKRVLVVLDNARDVGQVRPLLPGSPGCLVVVTSRIRLIGLAAAEGARQITLDVLAEGEAREVLARRLGAGRAAAEPGAVGELARLCGRLPLALAVAAARAATRPAVPLSAAAAELDGAAGRLRGLETADPVTDVRTVFSWSCQYLAPLSARLFRLMGLHPGPDITVPAAAVLLDATQDAANDALTALAAASLTSEHVPGRYGMHDLLRAYAGEQAEQEPQPQRAAAIGRVLDYYLHTSHAAALLLEPHRDPLQLACPVPGVAPGVIADDRQAMAWFTAEQQVLAALSRLAGSLGLDRYAWQLPAVMATFYERQGAWSEHAAAQHAALAAASRAADVAGQAIAHTYLIHISSVYGSHDQARRHFRQAMVLFEQAGNRTGAARAHLAVGHSLSEQGRHYKAMKHAVSALELYCAAGHQGGQAVVLHNIGWTQAQLGDHRRALTSLRQAQTLFRDLGHQPGEAAAWGSLGFAHTGLGRRDEAIDCYTRAVELSARLGDRWSQADHLTDLGRAQEAAGQIQAALRTWREAADILDSLHDPAADKIRTQIEQSQPGRNHRRESAEPDAP